MAESKVFNNTIKAVRLTLTVIAIIMAVISIFVISFGGRVILATAYFYIEIGLLMAVGFLSIPMTKSRKIGWFDAILAALVLIATMYNFFNTQRIDDFSWMFYPPTVGFIIAIIFNLICLEAARRAGGPFFAGLIAFFLFYPMFSGNLPGFLWAPSTSFHDMVSFQFFGSGGIFGMMARVLAYILLLFMLFSTAITVFGGGDYFLKVALAILGTSRGGAAKVAVGSSALMASISGSSTANVVTTGSVTIPTMKRTGYSPEEAGAVESCASVGGAVMPPVMGAAGFVMAQFLNIHYAEVALAAFVPASLFFAILFFGVDVLAVRNGLTGIRKEEKPRFFPTLGSGWYYLLAIFVLVYYLFFMRQELAGAFYASAMLVVIGILPFIRKRDIKGMLHKLVEFLEETGKIMAFLTMLLAPLGILIGALFFTGVGTALGIAIERLAGGSLIALMLLAALASFIMGCGGMSITAGYIILAVLIAPAMIKAGNIYPLSAHLFLLFCSLWTVITPPVAANCFAACAISGGKYMKTCLQSMRLGVPIFLLPFMLVYNTELSFSGTVPAMLIAFVMSFIALALISCGLWGFIYWIGRLNALTRILIILSGLAMIPQEPLLRYGGLGVAVAVILINYLVKKFVIKSLA